MGQLFFSNLGRGLSTEEKTLWDRAKTELTQSGGEVRVKVRVKVRVNLE